MPGISLAPVEIAAAVHVAATGHGHPESEGVVVALGKQVGARLRDLVRLPPGQRHLLGVRQPLALSVGLVARRDDDLADDVTGLAARIQESPRSPYVRLEGGDRVGPGRGDDRLGGQVEDGLRSLLGHRPGKDAGIHHGAADDPESIDEAGLVQLRPGSGVHVQGRDLGSQPQQPFDKPTANEARRSRDQDTAARPESHQIFQGAFPVDHCSSRLTTSRRVSMHCQKPSCL